MIGLVSEELERLINEAKQNLRTFRLADARADEAKRAAIQAEDERAVAESEALKSRNKVWSQLREEAGE